MWPPQPVPALTACLARIETPFDRLRTSLSAWFEGPLRENPARVQALAPWRVRPNRKFAASRMPTRGKRTRNWRRASW